MRRPKLTPLVAAIHSWNPCQPCSQSRCKEASENLLHKLNREIGAFAWLTQLQNSVFAFYSPITLLSLKSFSRRRSESPIRQVCRYLSYLWEMVGCDSLAAFSFEAATKFYRIGLANVFIALASLFRFNRRVRVQGNQLAISKETKGF